MRIESATIDMQASHQRESRLQVSERLEMWVGERPGTAPREGTEAQVSISAAARQAHAAEVEAQAMEGKSAENDPKLIMLMRLVEMLTGKPVRLFDARELTPGSATTPPADTGNTAAAAEGGEAPARAGFGLAYDYHREYHEEEHTRFSAQGSIRTADGRQVDFALELAMQRSYTETESVSLRAGDARMKDPLMLDFGGSASELSDLRFEFDLDADGTAEALPVPTGRGFLAIDRDASGHIEDGRELFGAISGDGFAELAALDDDGNGWIDEADGAWSSLRVWQPDAEGEGRLMNLAEANVGAVYLGRVDTPFRVTDAANDTLAQVRTTGVYLREDGSVGSVSQVDLAV